MNTKRIKIFVKLKLKEIWNGLICVLIAIVALALYIFLIAFAVQGINWLLDRFPNTFNIAGISLVVIVGVFALIVIFKLIHSWIKSNWKEAGELCKRGN